MRATNTTFVWQNVFIGQTSTLLFKTIYNAQISHCCYHERGNCSLFELILYTPSCCCEHSPEHHSPQQRHRLIKYSSHWRYAMVLSGFRKSLSLLKEIKQHECSFLDSCVGETGNWEPQKGQRVRKYRVLHEQHYGCLFMWFVEGDLLNVRKILNNR